MNVMQHTFKCPADPQSGNIAVIPTPLNVQSQSDVKVIFFFVEFTTTNLCTREIWSWLSMMAVIKEALEPGM